MDDRWNEIYQEAFMLLFGKPIELVPTKRRLETERLKDEFWLREIGIAP